MTLFVPDISHHQAGISIKALKDQGAAALIARVGQGAGRRTNGQTYGTTRDREWVRHRDEARRVGLPLVAYWYIGNLISADENARLAAEWVGDRSIPWMLDHEDASGSIASYHQVKAAFARRGLRVVLGYIPEWYWSGAGGRVSLAPGPPLVSSRYSTREGNAAQIYVAAGGDEGRGWASYGNRPVALWQFTDKAQMAGMKIDCSAYRGTRAQLAALLGGKGENPDMEANDTFWVSDWKGDKGKGKFGGFLYNLTQEVTDAKTAATANRAAIAALAAAVAADKDVDPAELGQLIDDAVAAHTPTAQELLAGFIPTLQNALDEVLGADNQAQAKAVVDALVARLNAGG